MRDAVSGSREDPESAQTREAVVRQSVQLVVVHPQLRQVRKVTHCLRNPRELCVGDVQTGQFIGGTQQRVDLSLQVLSFGPPWTGDIERVGARGVRALTGHRAAWDVIG